MSPPAEREVAEALAALQRLHAHGVLSLEEAQEAARLISGDDSFTLAAPPEPPAQARREGGGSSPA